MLTAERQCILFALEGRIFGFQGQCHQRDTEHPSDEAKSEDPDKPDWAKRSLQPLWPCCSENFEGLFC